MNSNFDKPSKFILQLGIILKADGKVSSPTLLGFVFVYAARNAGIITSLDVCPYPLLYAPSIGLPVIGSMSGLYPGSIFCLPADRLWEIITMFFLKASKVGDLSLIHISEPT